MPGTASTSENLTSDRPATTDIKSADGAVIFARQKHAPYRSKTVQLCLILAAMGLLAVCFPGHLDSADAVQPELRHYVSKVATFLASDQKPQVVLLGSSLMLYPATLCDLEEEGRKPVDIDWYAAVFMPSYERANHFERLLKQECRANCQIENLAVASSMMSDHCLLLQAMVEAGKQPKLIICGIAPRDFGDNNQPDCNAHPGP